jgi:hypothetical protein
MLVRPGTFAEWASRGQIPLVTMQPAPPPPPHVPAPRLHPVSASLALAEAEFPFRALAALAGRAAIGGARELLLAALLAARMVEGVVGRAPLPAALRRPRAAAAKAWLSSLALPTTARGLVARVIDATAGDEVADLRAAWSPLVAALSPLLDQPARSELARLTSTVQAPPA